MSEALISVIIPVYNGEKYIKKCIDSIINQTYRNLEIIVINDGSTDDTKSICDDFSVGDARVRVVHKENTGVSDTRNYGLEIASGEYIGFVDADDYVEPDMYEKMFFAMERTASDICCAGYIIEDSSDMHEKTVLSETVVCGEHDIFKEYLRQNVYSGIGDGNWNKLFKKSVIGDLRYNSYAYGEDVDFQSRIFEKTNKMVCIPNKLYHHIVTNDGASQKAYNSRMNDLIMICDERADYIYKKYPDLIAEAEAFRLTWYMVIIQIINETSGIKNNKEIYQILRDRIVNKYSLYKENPYAKRLDKFYVKAIKINALPLASAIRKVMVCLKKR